MVSVIKIHNISEDYKKSLLVHDEIDVIVSSFHFFILIIPLEHEDYKKTSPLVYFLTKRIENKVD